MAKKTLKDLFIPYAGNEYQPHSLRPRRLIFHTIIVLLLQVIIAGFVIFFPTGAFLTPDLMVEESRRIIALTNELRQGLKINLLAESPTLNQAAFDKAQDMLLNQYFAHISPENKSLTTWLKSVNYQYDIAGENLAMGFADASEVMNGWKQSPTHYANLTDTDYKEIGVAMISGPYQDFDTTLVAQYFALPANVSLQVESPKIETAVVNQNNQPVNNNVNVNSNQPAETPKPVITNQTNANQNLVNINQSIKPPVLAPALTPIIEPVNQPTIEVPTLTKPELTYPANNTSVADNKLRVVVYAPGVERVLVYLNGQELISRESTNSNFFDFEIIFSQAGEQFVKFKSVKGSEEQISDTYTFFAYGVGPSLDRQLSKLTLVEPVGQKDKIVYAEVYLSDEAKEAFVLFNNFRINLEPTETIKNNFRQWRGQTIIFSQNQKQVFSTIFLPILTVKNQLGEEFNFDLKWENVTPVKPSLFKQYFFLKNYPLNSVDLIFDVTNWYYTLILTIAIVALILNIFIEIKKQYPHLILSTLGFIILLVILIIL